MRIIRVKFYAGSLIFIPYIITGMLTLSSATITPGPVCHVGGSLQLTCTASLEFLQWSFMLVSEQGRDDNIIMFITASAPSNQPMPVLVVVNSTTFTLRRTSVQGDTYTSDLYIIY